MPPGPLPPTYVNVPAFVIYDKETPEGVKETYMMLRGLAWQSKYQETEPYSFAELSEMFGKTAAAIYEHVQILSRKSWLLFKKAAYSRYTFSFPPIEKQPSLFSTDVESVLINSSGENHSNTGINNTLSASVENDDGKKRDPNLDHPAVRLYRGIARITPNSYQRELIVKTVTNCDLWKSTIEHWLFHGWNKTNVGGMLNSYSKGGVDGCNMCRNGNGHKPPAVSPPSKPIPTEAERQAKAAEMRAKIQAARAQAASEAK